MFNFKMNTIYNAFESNKRLQCSIKIYNFNCYRARKIVGEIPAFSNVEVPKMVLFVPTISLVAKSDG